MIRLALLASAALLAAAAPAVAAAQAAPDATPPASSSAGTALDPAMDKDTITVGVAAAYVPDYDGSNDYRVFPAPIVFGTYKGLGITVLGNRASVNLVPQAKGTGWNIEAGPVGVLDLNRTSNSRIDDPRVRALAQRKTAFELGGYVGLSRTGVVTSPYDKLTVTISSRWDVSGANRSYVVTPTLTYLTPLSLKAAVGIGASGTYVGTKYARYYYGVSAPEARVSGLPVYTPAHDWNSYTVGGFGTYAVTGDLLHGVKVIAGGTYSREEGATARSPLITIAGSRNQWIGAAGLAYTF